jgi:hypothetical protein
MNPQRMGGIILIVVGVVLFVIGMNASDSVADRWTNLFTGHFTDKTMWYIVGGIASAIVGVILSIVGGRTATS